MRTILAAALLAATTATAAPCVVSDPWPATGPPPGTCTATPANGNAIPLTLIDAAPGSRAIRHDTAALPNGPHTWSVACANIWGSSGSVPFEFAKGAPSTPAGLRLVP